MAHYEGVSMSEANGLSSTVEAADWESSEFIMCRMQDGIRPVFHRYLDWWVGWDGQRWTTDQVRDLCPNIVRARVVADG